MNSALAPDRKVVASISAIGNSERLPDLVVPAKRGSRDLTWLPAFAGMTIWGGDSGNSQRNYCVPPSMNAVRAREQRRQIIAGAASPLQNALHCRADRGGGFADG